MPKMKIWDGTKWIIADAKDSDTVDGKHASDFAPRNHVGAGGTAHALATDTVHGFLSSTDKDKLNQFIIENGTLKVDDGTGTFVEVSGSGGGGGGAISQLKNTLTLGADSNTASIGIADYQPGTDALLVYQNSTYIHQDTDYTIATDGSSITKVSGVWTKGTVLEFVVLSSFDSSVAQNLKYTEYHNTVDITTDGTTNIPIGIIEYVPATDILRVHQDNIRLFEGENYTVDANTMSVNLLNYSVNTGTQFHFGVLKKVRDKNWEAGIPTEYNFAAKTRDANGIYTVTEYTRSNGSLAVRSTLSNPNADGNYQTDTVDYYALDGATIILTKTWTLTYDIDGNVISRKVN